MSAVSPFSEAKSYTPQGMATLRGVRMAAAFGSPADEYRAAREQVALFDRSDRGLVAVAGSDRKVWLDNLVTNAVRALPDFAGAYAFVVNVKGRILFDANILCLPDVLWLDLDAQAVAAAAAHFDRYLISEDVRITDLTGQFARLGCAGPGTARLAAQLGVADFDALRALQSRALADVPAQFLRHDFAGGPGFELIIARGEAPRWWDRLVDTGVRPAGYQTLDLLRMEAGIPWLGRELHDGVLPPETGQTERAVSYHKGCYLGQEVIERMRAHGAVTKRLVRLRLADGRGLELPLPLRRDEAEVGHITSLAAHLLDGCWVGLGYLQSSVTGYAEIVTGTPPRAVLICSA